MARFMKYVYWLYALIFVLVLVAAVLSAFGYFEHEFMDPGM